MKEHTGLYHKGTWTVRFPVTVDEGRYAYHLCQWVRVRGLGEQQIHSRKIEDGLARYLLSPSFVWLLEDAIEKEESPMTDDNLLTEEQWRRLLAYHRKRLGHFVTGLEEALQFLESVRRLQALAGPTPEEIEGIKASLLNMAESEPAP